MFRKLFIITMACLAVSACKSTKNLTPVRTTSITYVRADIESDPAGADVILNGNKLGTTPCQVELPLKVTTTVTGTQTSTSYGVWKMSFSKNEHVEETTFRPQQLGRSNGAYILSYDFRQKSYINDPTIVAGEADKMVSRDNPGATALEGTILRWYFDSDPRGARIYWRVISSIPQVVKNTNETYLMTTPFEETRSFNIQGLTYENSRDVQIEIKVVKSGYEPQVKRYNVRQAIDQQEISGFFELVRKEPSGN